MGELEGRNSKKAVNLHFIDGLVFADDLSCTIEADAKASNPESPASDAAAGGDGRQSPVVRRRGGPRTPTGKQRSKYNALKSGFFAKVAVIDSPFYSESKKKCHRLLREYIRDFEPADVWDMHLIEFVVKGLLDLERLWSVQLALTLERHIPLPKNDPGDLSAQFQDLLAKNFKSTGQGSGPTKEAVPLKTEEASLKAERARIDTLRKALPSFDDTEWVQGRESHIKREIYRALTELERRRNLRRGMPPR